MTDAEGRELERAGQQIICDAQMTLQGSLGMFLLCACCYQTRVLFDIQKNFHWQICCAIMLLKPDWKHFNKLYDVKSS